MVKPIFLSLLLLLSCVNRQGPLQTCNSTKDQQERARPLPSNQPLPAPLCEKGEVAVSTVLRAPPPIEKINDLILKSFEALAKIPNPALLNSAAGMIDTGVPANRT